jgi:hypothetical protein
MENDKAKYVQWFCGFYEGEGWVSNDISNNNRIRVGIAQNDVAPLELAQRLWGGHIRKRVRKSPASDKVCTCHEWILYHHDSVAFLDDIRPHMIIPYKINQVEKVLETCKMGIERRFKCKHCDNDYASPAGRRRHELHVHLNVNSV